MNGKFSSIYASMYFSVSKMLHCLDRGGGLFICAFSLFIVCLVYLLVGLFVRVFWGFFLPFYNM